MDNDSSQPTTVSRIRDWLAFIFTIGTLLLLLGLSITAIVFGRNPVEILNILLPVIGTWVGTVLAFYFGKENFDAATKSVTTMAKLTASDKLRTILAKDKMISKDQMFLKRTPENAILLLATLDDLKAAKKGERIPVLDAQDFPKYVVHRSTIDQFLTSKARQSNPPADLHKLTLQDLLDDKELGKMLASSFVALNENATLQDVKAAMDAVSNAQDAFITKNGNASEPIMGWVTNNIVNDNARV